MNAPEERPTIFRFGVFELDTLAHELRKQGRRVRLQEQPYQILLMMVERSGTVVTREELRAALWPSSVYVDFDHGLNNAIGRLREALGDAAAMPTFIETIPRVGYRFIFPVVPSAATTAVQHVTNGSPPVQDAQLAVPAPAESALDSGQDEIRPVEIRREAASRWSNRRTIPAAIAIAALLALIAVFWPAQRSADEVRLRSQGTSDPEAWRLYGVARGQISWLYGNPDWDVIKRSYQQAIARDPNFAAAHAGLAYYYFNREGDSEEGIRLGRAAAEHAIALDPELSMAVGARANFESLRYLMEGDYKSYERALEDFRRAQVLDPRDVQALFHYARAVYWFKPELALDLFERTVQLDPIRYGAVGFAAVLMSRQGQHKAARERLMQLYDGNPEQKFHNAIHLATFEYFQGNLDRAILLMREGRRSASIKFWPLYMSLGDREAAQDVLGRLAPNEPLRDAARQVMAGRYNDALASLDRRLAEFPTTRVLDLPAARLALIAARPGRAREILEERLPDLVTGIEPINARNVLPALDLVAAWAGTGAQTKARLLLNRGEVFLDGPDVPRWPMFIFLRARAHALAGERELAQRALDRAYEGGFRTTWGVDVFYQDLGYIDPVAADPAFAALRDDPRFKGWLERIEADNALQLERLHAHDADEQSVRRARQ